MNKPTHLLIPIEGWNEQLNVIEHHIRECKHLGYDLPLKQWEAVKLQMTSFMNIQKQISLNEDDIGTITLKNK